MGLFKLFHGAPDVAQLELAGDLKGLVRALKYKGDKQPRIEAAQALAVLGDARAIEPLVAALDDLLVRDMAAGALCQFGEAAVPALIHALEHPSVSVRLFAAQTLGRIGDARAIHPLLALCKHDKPQMRKVGVEALSLGRFKTSDVLATLIDALRDVDAAVRETAVNALGELRDPKSVLPLIEILHGSEQVLKAAATRALGAIGDARAVEALKAAYEKGDVRADTVLKALGQIGTGEAVPTIISALQHRDSRVQHAAEGALGQLGATAIEPLINALAHSEAKVRVKVAQALGILGDPRAVEPLIQLFTDSDRDVQAEAATAVGFINGAETISKLFELLRDSRRAVRWCAAWALWHTKHESAVLPLIYALKDKDSSVREVAIAGLRSSRDARAVPALIDCLQDSDANVRQSAVKALATLGDVSLDALIRLAENGEDALKMQAIYALQLMSGENYGEDTTRWRAWANRLEQPPQ